MSADTTLTTPRGPCPKVGGTGRPGVVGAPARGGAPTRSPHGCHLTISLPSNFELWWRLLADFRRAHPEVKLDVFTSERRVDLAAEGIDVAIRIGDLARADYVGRRLTAYRHVLVASRAFLDRHPVTRPDDLLDVPCAGFRAGPEYALSWTLGERTVRPSPVVLVNDYAKLRALALAGDVLAELPPFLASESVAAGDLVRVLPRAPLPETTVTAVIPERRHTPAPVLLTST